MAITRRSWRHFALCLTISAALLPRLAAARMTQHRPAHHAPHHHFHHVIHQVMRRHTDRRHQVRHTTRLLRTDRAHPHRHVVHADPPRPVVVIDPGHGGKDSGAIGISGVMEKTITLATALDLRRILDATHKYRVDMTRSRDVFVSLPARVAFARTHHAALVIAIHANASRNAHAHGASVWIWSDDHAITHLTGNGPRQSHDIANALSASVAPAPDSAWLQYTMIDNLSDDIHMDNAPAREARFYVLKLHDVPSVLLEMGFLTNRHDEALLKRPSYRRTISRAIRDAINDYFAKLGGPGAHT
jgi:N-acetylmuramoyl-L-alanine amidase